MSEALTHPTKENLAHEAEDWSGRAQALVVTSAESCVNASHLLRSIKMLRAGIAAFWTPHIEAAMETKRKAEVARKALADERDRMDAPLIEAEGTLKRRLLAWETEQERVRLEQERALQAEAQRQAEAATLDAAAALELEAQKTGDAGMLAEAQDILAQPIEAPVVTVERFVPKVQGITYRDNWKAQEPVNVRELAAAVGAGTLPITFVTPNLTAINQYIRATKGTQDVPGVRIINDRQIAARA